MDMRFSPEELAFRDEVREFIANNYPHELKGARRGEMSKEGILKWHRVLYKKGWVVPHWPVEYGGTGWTEMQKYIWTSECTRYGTPGLSPMGLRMCGPMLMKFGTREQKDYYLPRILSGEDYWCQGYSEPGAGSDLASLQLKAVSEGDDYVLNGTKMWITNAPAADTLVVYAKTDISAGSRGISAFIVERGFKGFSVAQKLDKLGMRGSETGELVFEDCEIPAENVMGPLNGGPRMLISGLDYERAVPHAAPIGIIPAARYVGMP